MTVLAAHAEEQRYLLRTYEIMTRKLKAELRRHRPPHSTSTKFPPSRAPPPPPSYPEASSPHSGPCSPGNLAHAALLSNGIRPTPCSSPRIALLCRWSLASHRAPLPLPFSPRHPATAELKQEQFARAAVVALEARRGGVGERGGRGWPGSEALPRLAEAT